jgi:hypothetical protein
VPDSSIDRYRGGSRGIIGVAVRAEGNVGDKAGEERSANADIAPPPPANGLTVFAGEKATRSMHGTAPLIVRVGSAGGCRDAGSERSESLERAGTPAQADRGCLPWVISTERILDGGRLDGYGRRGIARTNEARRNWRSPNCRLTRRLTPAVRTANAAFGRPFLSRAQTQDWLALGFWTRIVP